MGSEGTGETGRGSLDPRLHAPTALVDGGRHTHPQGRQEGTSQDQDRMAQGRESPDGTQTHRVCRAYSSLCKVPEERDFLLHPRNDRRGEQTPGG